MSSRVFARFWVGACFVFMLQLANAAFCADRNDSAGTSSSPVHAQAEISKSTATIGEPLTLKIKVTYPKGVEIIGGIDEPEAAGLELKNPKDWRDRVEKSEVLGRSFSVVGYQLGRFMIESTEITYRNQEGKTATISSNAVYLSIESIDQGKEKTDIRDVKGVVKLPYEILKYAVPAAVALVLLALLLFYLLYFRKRELERLKKANQLSPSAEALQNLRELFDSTLIRDGRVKQYYLRFSEILKGFLEKQFGIQALEATTSEIAQILKRTAISDEVKQKLIQVLESADFAKFAKWIPAPTDILNLNKQAEEVVILLAAPTEPEEKKDAVP